MNCDTCGITFMRWSDLRQHVAADSHQNKTKNNFSCLSCALSLDTISDVIQHIDSEEHIVISLASDNPFDKPPEASAGHHESFPPLYFCMLCGCRDGNPYEFHLKSVVHKNTARLMREICKKNTIHYTNNGCDEKLLLRLKTENGTVYCELCDVSSSNWYKYQEHLKTTVHIKAQEFMNKLINVNRISDEPRLSEDDKSFPFFCQLCNLHFGKHVYYKRHIEDDTHKRLELFMLKILEMVESMDVVIRGDDLKITDTFRNSFPPLYYCELCDLFCFEVLGYVQHKKTRHHARYQEFLEKLDDKRKGNAIRLNLKPCFEKPPHYCKLCISGFIDLQGYSSHLKGKSHSRLENFIKSLTDAGDINFMNIYIDAQSDMLFGKIPPNYCKICNILHSKLQKYERHLETDEHKLAEQSYLNSLIPKNKKIKNAVHPQKGTSQQVFKNGCPPNSKRARHDDNVGSSPPSIWFENTYFPSTSIGAGQAANCHPYQPRRMVSQSRVSYDHYPARPGFQAYDSNVYLPRYDRFIAQDHFANPPQYDFVTQDQCNYPPMWSPFEYRGLQSSSVWPCNTYKNNNSYSYPPYFEPNLAAHNYPPWHGLGSFQANPDYC